MIQIKTKSYKTFQDIQEEYHNWFSPKITKSYYLVLLINPEKAGSV